MEVADETRAIERVLDAVDERTRVQSKLHDAMTDGFLWLARERYRDALATYRLEQVVSESREMTSRVHVSIEQGEEEEVISFGCTSGDEGEGEGGEVNEVVGLRKRHGRDTEIEEEVNVDDGSANAEGRATASRPMVMAMPSKEMREAVRCFSESIGYAVELARENNSVMQIVSNTRV